MPLNKKACGNALMRHKQEIKAFSNLVLQNSSQEVLKAVGIIFHVYFSNYLALASVVIEIIMEEQ